VVRKHEAVSEVSAVGVPDPNGGGKIPRAWVVLHKDKAKNYPLMDIQLFANGNLSLSIWFEKS